MPNIEGSVVEPDVGFYANAANGEGSVEGKIAPVVIVGVNAFLGEEERSAKSSLFTIDVGHWKDADNRESPYRYNLSRQVCRIRIKITPISIV